MDNSNGGAAIEELPEGLYELLKTEGLVTTLSKLPQLEPRFGAVGVEYAPDILSSHVADAVRDALASAPPTDRVALANRLLEALQQKDRIAEGPTVLHSLHRPDTLKRRQLRAPQQDSATPRS